ncbi:MAG TPA: hypothetical protein VGI92_06465 [Gemmatimonadales bacterium]|jgi:hypothetical protein
MNGRIAIILAVVLLMVWALLGLIIPVGSGSIHLLLALGVVLLIRGVVTLPPRTDVK